MASAVGSLFSGGKTDVLELLKEDHRKVDGYFQEVKADEDKDHEKTFKKIKAELDIHAHVEEVIFYPYLLEAGGEELQKIVREGVEEHAQVKTLLQEMSELRGKDDVFKAKLKVLMENVEHHVEEEESEMFPLVEDEVEKEALVLLAERVEKEKAKVGGKTKAPASRAKQKAARR
jgi:iron-sulfur cluster repair protein YtfE (RIC family)